MDGHTVVYGSEGSNIVDSSIVPMIVSGNWSASAITLAEKAADPIAGRDLLPPADAPLRNHPKWRTQQR